jgi:hypothetical protein
MLKRQPCLIFLPFGLMLIGLLFGAIKTESQGQQPAPPKKETPPDTSCIYDPAIGLITDCLQKGPNGDLLINQKVLKNLQFDSYGLSPVLSNTNGWMYVSRAGKVLITGVPVMDNGPDTFHDGLVRVVKNNKYGFSDRQGHLVIPPAYDGALNFEKGKAKVCNHCTTKCTDQSCEYHAFSGGQWFEINTNGAVVSTLHTNN